VKLGTEDKRKTIIALALLALGTWSTIHMLSSGSSNTEETAATTPAATTTTTAAEPARRPVNARRNNNAARVTPVLTFNGDPRLHLALLRESEETVYSGNGRNIFHEYEAPIPPPRNPVIAEKQLPQGPPPPPPPPPINLKFFGFASEPGDPKKIFLAAPDGNVFVASEGDIVNRRYKILKIGPNSVDIEDVLNNNRQTIPLSQ
jgi:hypothetical protein